MYFLHPLLPWSASLPSSLAECQHHILFHTVWQRLLASYGQRTSSSGLLPSVPATKLVFLVAACPISISIDSFILFSVQGTLSIFLPIHISQSSISFSISLAFVHVSQPYSITGKMILYG